MDKLKAVLLNHGEKLVAGIFALLAIMSLTTASWSPEHRNPNQIVEKTQESTAAIERNIWPDTDKQLFADVTDVESKVRDDSKKLTRPEEFQIGAFNPSLHRVKEKNTAVAVLAPESPRAVALVVPVALPPEEDEEESEETTESETSDKEEKSDDELSEEERFEKLIAQKYGIKTSTDGAAGGEMAGLLSGGGAPGGYGSEAGGYPGGAEAMGEGMSEGMGGAYGMEGNGGYGGGYGAGELFGAYGDNLMSEKKRVRVAAGVSVTMVVDLRKQREMLRRALHLTGDYKVAQALIEYVDLKVERRRQQGPGVWDEWEPVSSEDLGEILKESFGIDRDIVSPAVTRNTITMPLPRRAAGRWQPEEASHPRVENFVLSEEEKELIDKWNRRVNEKLEAVKKDAPVKVESRGFSQFATTATDAGAMSGYGGYGMEMMGSGDMGNPYGDAYDVDSFASSLGEGTQLTDQQKSLLDETRATADHRLLLVRFMDFTVERGFGYQYRVRLEMKNPNYGKPLDELADPALGLEPTLFSDWSQPTPPTLVPTPHRTYLTDVDGRAGRSEEVSVMVYTDTTDTGLPVLGELKSVLMGLPIAGTENIEIVDLTTEEVALREVALRTNEILAAAKEIPRVYSSEHPALKDLLSRRRDLIPDQICVIDGEGGMKLRSVGENADQQKEDTAAFAFILKQYEAWKKDKEAASDFFGEGGYGEGAGADGGSGLGMGYGASAAGGYYGGYGGGGEGGEGAGGSGGRGRSRSRR